MPDGMNPWEIDWGKAAQAQAGKPPWEGDWSKAGEPQTPQYTAQSPFTPPSGATQEQVDSFFGLPAGSYVKTPQGLRVVPKPPEVQPGAVDPSTGAEIDWRGYGE